MWAAMAPSFTTDCSQRNLLRLPKIKVSLGAERGGGEEGSFTCSSGLKPEK